MYRVLASESEELEMLNEMEGTSYTYKPGMYVDYVTPEVKRKIREAYITYISQHNAGGASPDSSSVT